MSGKKVPLTRQGVRDLSGMGTRKTVGIRLAEVPPQHLCSHPMSARQELDWGYVSICRDCGGNVSNGY